MSCQFFVNVYFIQKISKISIKLRRLFAAFFIDMKDAKCYN